MKLKSLAASLGLAAFGLLHPSAAAAVATFESFPLPPAGYWNGSDGSGGFTEGGTSFHNNYDPTYDSWSGFAVSNHSDSATQGWTNQYSSITGSGANGSANYVVGYHSTYEAVSTRVNFSSLTSMAGKGAFITNTTWGALEMKNGGGFGAKVFGGPSGDDPDWFKLTIQGFAGVDPSGVVEFYLADFRFSDNSQDYILQDWSYVDFSPLGDVDRIDFSLSSSDNSITLGMNTPAFFAMDDLLAVPEPSVCLIVLSSLGLLLLRKR